MLKVFLAALILVGFGVFGMCFNIIFRKNGQFPQTDVGSNDNMKKLGIKCMHEIENEMWGDKAKGSCKELKCSETYSDACAGCGLAPLNKSRKESDK